jgi:hypothetical protein
MNFQSLEAAVGGNNTSRYALKPDERSAFEDAKVKGFVVTRSRSRYNLHNAYWRYCELASRPFVEIRPHGRFAQVRMDMFTVRFNLSEASQDLAWNAIERFTKGSATCEHGQILCGSNHVPIDRAEAFAKALMEAAEASRPTAVT